MKIKLLLLLLILIAAVSFVHAQPVKSQAISPITSNQQPATTSFLRSNGMKFTQNKGQLVDKNQHLRPDILFNGDGGGADVYIRKTGISYVLSNIGEVMHEVDEQVEEMIKNRKITEQDEQKEKTELLAKQDIILHRFDVDFVGGNPNPQTQTADQVDGYTNYYYAHCPQGITNVNSYNEVTVKNMYNNIDVKYYGGKQHGLKYDIVVNPGADPSQVKLKYSGAKNIALKNGKLQIETSLGTLGEYIPKVYQNINGNIVDVLASYVLTPGIEGEAIVNFKFSIYNSSFPLVIDPWTTYYGGKGDDLGTALATDSSGNVLITGYTASFNFPVLAGYQVTNAGGGGDAFLVKFDATGTRLWATYYGGNSYDYSRSVATDGSGNVSMTGYTASTNFPVLAGSQMSNAGGLYDAFVVKFNPTGTRLWATYYGGSGDDRGNSIATDGSGNVFITGYAASANLPVLGGYQVTNGGGLYDAFVIKFDPTGIRLWATYYGGSGDDRGNGIITDGSGNVFITGYTDSPNLPVLAGYQMTYAGGGSDDFCLKFDGAGTRLWATYYGGTDWDGGYGIATDGSGNVFITGYTASLDFPVLTGCQMTYGGGYGDAFVVKLDGTGTRLWATYYGGSDTEEGFGITVEQSSGNSYITGDTYSTDFPVTTTACLSSFAGGSEDNYLASFDPSGNRLCATYVGGNGHDEELSGGNIAVYGCSVYITGFTPGSYPVTPGSFQTTYGGGPDDAWIAQLPKSCSCSIPVFTTSSTPTACVSNSNNGTAAVTVSGGCTPYTYLWSNGQTTSTATSLGTGIYTVTITDACNSCISNNNTTTVTVTNDAGGLTLTSTQTNSICSALGSATVTATGGTPNYTYSWSPSGGTNATATDLSAGNYTVTVTDANGCNSTQTFTLTASGVPTASVTATKVNCNGGASATATATATGGSGSYTYSWSPSGQTTSTATGLGGGTYTVTVTDTNGCTTTQTINITQPTILTATVSVFSASCGGGTGTGSASVTASGGTPNYTYAWNPSGGSSSTATGLSTGNYTVTVTDNNGCSTTKTVNITQPTVLTLTATATPILCNGGTGSASVTPAGGAPGYSYNWLPSGGANSTATGLGSGSYTVTVTDANNCTSTASITITQPTSVTINSITPTNASCSNSDGSAAASASGGTGTLTFSWSNGGTTATINNLASGTYIVTATDANGCTNSTTASIVSSTGPSVIVTSINTTCGKNNGSAVAAVSGGTGPYVYSWAPNGGNGATANSLPAATYTIIVTDANSCSTSGTTTILNSGGPLVNFTATPLVGITPLTVDFTNTTTGGIIWSWNFGDTTSGASNISSLLNPTHIYTKEGSYMACLVAQDLGGCTDSLCTTILAEEGFSIIIPNIFSPNGDTKNDNFTIKTSGVEKIDVSIFDRWGLKMGEINGAAPDIKGLVITWNGKTISGANAPDGTYYYIMKAYGVDGKTYDYQGFLTLVR